MLRFIYSKAERHYAECYYAELRGAPFKPFKPSVTFASNVGACRSGQCDQIINENFAQLFEKVAKKCQNNFFSISGIEQPCCSTRVSLYRLYTNCLGVYLQYSNC
jgi:hypothetical protein